MKKILKLTIHNNGISFNYDGKKYCVSALTYSQFHLVNNQEISKEKLKEILDFDLLSDEINVATSIINKYDLSYFDLVEKLKKKKIKNISKIVNYVKENNLIDEKSNAKIWAKYLYEKFYGPLRIRKYLIQKHINSNIINEVLNEFTDDDFLISLRSFSKEWINKKQYREVVHLKSKITNVLLGRGFTQNLIETIVEELNIHNDEQEAIDILLLQLKNKYATKEELINALHNKGYSYSRILKSIKENDKDDLH